MDFRYRVLKNHFEMATNLTLEEARKIALTLDKKYRERTPDKAKVLIMPDYPDER